MYPFGCGFSPIVSSKLTNNCRSFDGVNNDPHKRLNQENLCGKEQKLQGIEYH